MVSRILTGPTSHKKILRDNHSVTLIFQRYVDVLLAVVTLYFLVLLNVGSFSVPYQLLALMAMPMMLAVYHGFGVYRYFGQQARSGTRLVLAWVLVCCLLVVIGAATKQTEVYSRFVFTLWMVLGLALQLLSFLFFTYVGVNKHRIGRTHIRSLVVGSGDTAQKFSKLLNSQKGSEDRVMGVVSSDDSIALDGDSLGPLDDLERLIDSMGIQRVYIALPCDQSFKVQEIQTLLSERTIDIFWTPDISAFQLMNHSIKDIAGAPVFALNESPVTASRTAYLFKDFLDRAMALVCILVFSPLMIAAAIAVKWSSPGKIIYTQKRHGIDGRVINIRKFRSMFTGPVDVTLPTAQAVQGDPRITSVGRFIRKTSIDELPQLFNVLDGSMSLVGPRPHALEHNDEYRGLIKHYNNRHRTKPGITGLAQIAGFRGETDTIDKMERRVEMDIRYINNWSLSLDFMILLKTPVSLLLHKAY